MSYSRSSGFNLIHRSDLVNALLAILSTHQTINTNHPNDQDREMYQAGFEAALLAVAQMLGQSEIFLAEKAKLKKNSPF